MDTLEQRKERFVQAIHQALAVNSYTQRKLCDKLSLTIGSLSKYIAKKVDPLDVKLRIQVSLAESLGVTVDSLNAFYLSGKFHSAVTISDVQEFIRQSATAGELPILLKDVADLSVRLSGQAASPDTEARKVEPPRLWSDEEAKQLSQQAMAYFRECAQVEMLSPKEAWEQLKVHAQAEGMTTPQIERFREVISGWDNWDAEEVNALAPYGEFGAPGRALRRLSGGGEVEVLAVPGSGGAVVTVQYDP